MQNENLHVFVPGDWIEYRTKALSSHGLMDVGTALAQVIGATEGAALIATDGYPSFTIVVQTRDIITIYHLGNGKEPPLFVADSLPERYPL